MGRLLAIIRKEFIHIRRDPRTLVVMFLLPVVQLFLMGYAATTDIEHLRTVVLDADRTSQSRALVEAYRASNYFNIVSYVEDEKALARLVDGGQVRAGLIIPAGQHCLRRLAAGGAGAECTAYRAAVGSEHEEYAGRGGTPSRVVQPGDEERQFYDTGTDCHGAFHAHHHADLASYRARTGAGHD